MKNANKICFFIAMRFCAMVHDGFEKYFGKGSVAPKNQLGLFFPLEHNQLVSKLYVFIITAITDDPSRLQVNIY